MRNPQLRKGPLDSGLYGRLQRRQLRTLRQRKMRDQGLWDVLSRKRA